MSIHVAVTLDVHPGRLQAALELIRHDLNRSPQPHTGRHRSRVFQRLNTPGSLLRISEWESRAAYEQFQRTETFADVVATAGVSPSIRFYERLTYYARMATSYAVNACSTMTAATDACSDLETFITTEGRFRTRAEPGLISHEIYRSVDSPRTYLVSHSWRRLEDLERFRREAGPAHAQRLAALGATIDRFTGVLIAEYPAPVRPSQPELAHQT
jgi:quinol monooxygenase YgiN